MAVMRQEGLEEAEATAEVYLKTSARTNFDGAVDALYAEASIERQLLNGLRAALAEADAELDDLQQVHVALQRLVREAVRAQVADGLRHDAGELRVHGDVGVPLDELADDGHLGVERRRPDVLDLDLRFVFCEGGAAAAA